MLAAGTSIEVLARGSQLESREQTSVAPPVGSVPWQLRPADAAKGSPSLAVTASWDSQLGLQQEPVLVQVLRALAVWL